MASALPLHFGLAQVLDAREGLRRGRRAPAAGQRRWLWPSRASAARATTRRCTRRFVDQLMATFTPAFFERVRGLGLETRAAGLHRRPAALGHDADRADPGQPFAGLRGRRAASGPRGFRDAVRRAGGNRRGTRRPASSTSPGSTPPRRAAWPSGTWSGSGAERAGAARRGQDAGQLPVPGPAGDACSRGRSSSTAAATCATWPCRAG